MVQENNITDYHKNLQMYKAIFNSTPLAIVVWDENRLVKDWNKSAEKIFGWTREEMIGKDFFSYIIPEYEKEKLKIKASMLFKNIPSNSVNDNLTKDGKVITCQWYSSRILNEKGEVTEILSLAHDVTEKIRLERNLSQIKKMEAVGTLAGGIAHDFNNLLTVILGYSSVLEVELEGVNFKEELLAIKKAATQAKKLTQQLLAFSRKQIFSKIPVNINQIIYDMKEIIEPTLGESIELNYILNPNLHTIEADIPSMKQIILNLLVNARDAMQDKGKIVIKTENIEIKNEDVKNTPQKYAGDFLLLSVADNGCGISKETMEHIFEPFFTTKKFGKGTGLGLSTVFGIVNQHSGWIEVESELGIGSKFSIFLPKTEKTLKLNEKMETPEKLTGNGETILIIEDEHLLMNFVSNTLKKNNYKVLEAGTASEAIEIFRINQNNIDFIFSDVVLPDSSGMDLIDKIKEINPDIPILLNSGYTDDVQQLKEIQRHAFPFLRKPYNMNDLLYFIKKNFDSTE